VAKKSIGEIVFEAAEMKNRKDKIEWLQKWDNQAIRIVLKYMYDKNIKFLIPDTPPPYKPSEFHDIEGMMYKEARRLRIFVEGGGYDNLNQLKRESLFISLLQDVDKRDAKLLCAMITKKALKGLPKSVINEAYPGLIEEVANEEKSG